MAIVSVNATDTPNQGRQYWNANDIELDGKITTHKTSTDHDGRYYTETEVDAIVAGVTAAYTAAIGTARPRQKVWLLFNGLYSTNYMYMGNVPCSSLAGYAIPHAGAIVSTAIVDASGYPMKRDDAYTLTGVTHFSALSKIMVRYGVGSADCVEVMVNGSVVLTKDTGGTTPTSVLIEIELD